ncbi:MAG TPA: acetolactate synthase small subunit [Anaerolineae bacterium]|nr:acetolactate synthase small subunit [Anaerolineae bacterium]HID84522.1 acetolactate synthase small subunit [Anaerolineales bacterium]HIQ09308.1 acetolactate synthase small subunit [Anaerolineaceae bacterium]
MPHTFVVLVENKPGVLNRIASLFRRRNYNIHSLNVGTTHDPRISRMTLVVETAPEKAPLIEANLYKLVNVIDVQDVTDRPAVRRELALIKVRAPRSAHAEIINLASVFRANIVDVTPETLTIEVTGTSEKVDGLIQTLATVEVLEVVRTGVLAMTRGTVEGKRHLPGADAAR